MIMTTETMIRKTTNGVLGGFVEQFPNVKIKINLKESIEKSGMSLRKLSKVTGITKCLLIKLCNGQQRNIDFLHILAIANALKITDINEIISLDVDDSTKKDYENKREYMKETGKLTKDTIQAAHKVGNKEVVEVLISDYNK